MSPFLSVVCPLVAVIAATAPRAVPPSPATPASTLEEATRSTEVVRVHRYRLSGRIRPLLVWMGRDDVGFARVAWRADAEGRAGYELLIGTDPTRAPRGLNRWGYVAEQAASGGGDVVALMTGAMAGSLAEASADAASGPSNARLRVLRGRLADGIARAQLLVLGFERPPTIHDADAVLARLRYEPASRREATAPVPREARPGLLTAIADTLARVVPAARAGARVTPSAAVPYVFGRDVYELTVRSAKVLPAADPDGREVRAIETDLEIRALTTGARSRFWMRTAMDGPLAGVPLAVRWQPRWWLEVGMHLAE
jgi:hypothetical protein